MDKFTILLILYGGFWHNGSDTIQCSVCKEEHGPVNTCVAGRPTVCAIEAKTCSFLYGLAEDAKHYTDKGCSDEEGNFLISRE